VVDELVQYVTQSGDIDEAGVWYIQAFFDTGTWQGLQWSRLNHGRGLNSSVGESDETEATTEDDAITSRRVQGSPDHATG
jgi:hypothetical protein